MLYFLEKVLYFPKKVLYFAVFLRKIGVRPLLSLTTSFITISCEDMMKINARKYIVMQNYGSKIESTVHED